VVNREQVKLPGGGAVGGRGKEEKKTDFCMLGKAPFAWLWGKARDRSTRQRRSIDPAKGVYSKKRKNGERASYRSHTK